MGITSSESCFPNSGCEALEQKFIFQIGTLSCYSPPPSQHHNCLRNVPLYFKIIQLNIIIKKKKVTAIFLSFVSDWNWRQNKIYRQQNNHLMQFIFLLLNFSYPFICKFMEVVLDNNKQKLGNQA